MNKKWIVGVLVGLVVIGIAYVALNFVFLFLIKYWHPHVVTATTLQPVTTGLPPGVPPSPPPLPRLNRPAVVIDSQNYETENNWLAQHIALRIATLSYLAKHLGATSIPDIKATARVDANAGTVKVEIQNMPSPDLSLPTIVADLKPEFIWDANGFAQLATLLLGDATPPQDQDKNPLVDVPLELLTLTGPVLAKADMRISSEMQHTPLSPTLHEDAALLLVGIALRDRASTFTDYRQMLCRATAHLAFAKALTRDIGLSPTGLLADAGLRVLSGRETDAISHLDAIDATPGISVSVKSWSQALRLRAKGDWRTVRVDATSPLLLKIVWAHVLADDLTDLGAAKKLATLGNLDSVPDWGRCALTNPNSFSVDAGNTYAEPTAQLEFQELNQVLQIENAPDIDPKNAGDGFSRSLQEKVFYGNPPSIHIVGPDMFRDVARRHLMNEIEATSFWLTTLLGVPDEAKAYVAAMNQTFAGTRLWETVHFDKVPMDYPGKLAQLSEEHVTWEPWELAMSKFPHCPDLIYPDFHTLHAFYADGLPYGTAYDLLNRKAYSLNNAQLLADDPHPETFRDANPDVAHPNGDFLQKLAPDSFQALVTGTKVPDVIQRSKPMWDYSVQPMLWIERYTHGYISDEDHALLMQKYVALDPDQYFTLGTELRNAGKLDEAAAADRKGFDQALDQVAMSDSIGPLVDYDFTHDLKDEAVRIASSAASVGSKSGLFIYQDLLQKLGRLDEAEPVAQSIKDRYDDPAPLAALYAAHPEHFGDKNTQASKEAFPNGMTKVDLASFQGAPVKGCVFTTDSALLRQGGLQPGDIVVAFDSYKIESMAQYNYVRALSADPKMHLIIWRDGHYLTMTTSAPGRRFQVELGDYPPKPPQ